ncbi:MAG TPA: DUF4097 family beta strand repeat-containing protein [Bryobacteraceae bacterium]|jgi:hypothetical protein
MKNTLFAFIAFALAVGISFASQSRTFDRTLSVSGPVDLDVRSDPGGIVITAGPEGRIRIYAIIRPLYGRVDFDIAESNIRALAKNPPIEKIGNQIRVGYPGDPELLKRVSMHLEIETPPNSTVRAHTESGGIRIDGIDGQVETQTSSGRTDISNIASNVVVKSHTGAIVIRNIGGSVSARNASGGLQIINVHGRLEAETTSGRTEISDVLGELRALTHSGSISIDNIQGPVIAANHSGSIDIFQLAGPVDAKTNSGAIRISQIKPASIHASSKSGAIKVDLASSGGYFVDARSHSGKIAGRAVDGPQYVATNHLYKARVGEGGPVVDLDTDSSKINVD